MHEVFPAGRARDLAVITAATGGPGRALAVTAAPGDGRTTVLHAVAAGRRVLALPGLAEETDVPWAALQRLLAAVADDSPAPGVLRPVLAGGPPDAGTLPAALALAGVLRAAAGGEPAPLVVVDDAHLLDPQSWQVLRIAVRRLPVALLASVVADAAGHAAVAGLPVHRLSPLDDRASRDLLLSRAPDLAPETVAALTELAAGNAAALVELAAALTPEQRRGFAPPPETLPPGPLLHRLRAAVAALPERTRDALLLAAADVCTAHEAAAGVAGDLAVAEAAGLVEVGRGGVWFRPGVLRHVVYHDAPLARRRWAHLALAARGGGISALLQRAAVASRPDDGLARELSAAAGGAAPRLAATAQRYAGELFGDPRAASSALLAAAGSSWLAGRPHDAVRLLRQVARTPANATVRARARSLTAEMEVRGVPAAARDTLLGVAAELMPHDGPGAFEALQHAAEAISRTGDPGEFPALARRALAVVPESDEPRARLARHNVAGLADLMTGADDAGFRHLRSVLDLAGRVDEPAALVRAATAGILVGQDRRAGLVARRAAALARTGGAVALVPAALEVAAYAGLAAGQYAEATRAALDGQASARRAGRTDLADTHDALLAVLAALLGERILLGERAAPPGRHGGDAGGLLAWAAGLADLIDGDPRAAAERLGWIAGGGGPMLLRVAVVPHLVEAVAAVETRPPHIAGADAFDRWAGATRESAWLALRERCRALRAGDAEGAGHHFREALGRHREDGTDFARAHTELLYGRHLRRRRRPAEAREHLRRAAETFHRLDALRWAEQTVRELRAAGERTAGTRPAPRELTAQQERIAGLVAEGATNREVAERLHLSPRTVDHHLRNVFARLGVRSRTELARLLI